MDNSQNTPFDTSVQPWIDLDNQLSFLPHIANLTWSCRFLFKTPGAAGLMRWQGVCSVPYYLDTGLLPLTPGRSAPVCHLTLLTDPECSCKTCFQTPRVFGHHPITVYPLVVSCNIRKLTKSHCYSPGSYCTTCTVNGTHYTSRYEEDMQNSALF